ncbi:Protein UGT-64 [Aphelenchoides avenae]|nr:Protein UGT-64 [Aphelenchus avenae]
MLGERIWKGTMHSFMMLFVNGSLEEVMESFLDQHSDKIVEALNKEWDLVVLDFIFDLHGYAMALLLKHTRGVPYCIVALNHVNPPDAMITALGNNWAARPSMITPLPADSNDDYKPSIFSQRLVNAFEIFGGVFAQYVIGNFIMPSKYARWGVRNFDANTLAFENSLSVSDSIDWLGSPISGAPDVRQTGGHCQEGGPLEKEYADFVEDPKSKGTIYIAFGNYVPWHYAPEKLREDFFAALEEFTDHRIVFSYNSPDYANRTVGKHIKLTKWAPQKDILAHPRTKAFLTHSGAKSLREGLCSRTPLVLMPMFAEQSFNAKFALSLKLGTVLNKFTLDKQAVVDAVEEVLNNPLYKQRITKLRDIFLDRPIAALDDGAFYATRLIRHKQRPLFFKRKGMDQNLLEFHNLDWLLVVLAFVYAIAK